MTPACSDDIEAARSSIAAVIDANQSCTQDADCIIVGLGAGCFDSCQRFLGSSGKAAYEQAVAAADAGKCQEYKAAGCPRVIPPPCAPLPPASCRAGHCSEGGS
jgi:hypothetical protein